MYEYLDRRYALALYQIADEKGKVEKCLNELKEILELVKSQPKLVKIVEHPEISVSEKKKIFDSIFKDKIDEDIFRFLEFLIEKDRISQLEGNIREFDNIYLEKHNTLIAEVKTVVPMTEDEKDALIEKLETKYKKKVLIKSELDPSIIGGVYVNINNNIIDGTIKSKLLEMKKIMLKRD
jgi:F-type H+-transporting ATPase subunit delta